MKKILNKVRRRLQRAGRQLAERTCDCVVLPELPHGFDTAYDIRRRIRDLTTIVDVGANVGQSTVAFAEIWPEARIYSIEPFTAAFTRLKANVAGRGRIVCLQCAAGASPGTARVRLRQGLLTNSLLNAVGTTDVEPVTDATEVVRIRTLDELCAAERIDRIDLLKVDTEGYDLQALAGARQLLEAERISFVQVEAAMTSYNEKHVPLRDLQACLEAHGYVVFGLYDQTPEWSGQARLRFCNAVFVSSREMRRTPLSEPDLGFCPPARRHPGQRRSGSQPPERPLTVSEAAVPALRTQS